MSRPRIKAVLLSIAAVVVVGVCAIYLAARWFFQQLPH